MTVAVCFRCGEMKYGALNPCEKCGEKPQAENDFVVSLALTDHYLNATVLQEASVKIKKGEQIRLDPQSRQQLLKAVKSMRVLLPGRPSIPSKPWWKFW